GADSQGVARAPLAGHRGADSLRPRASVAERSCRDPGGPHRDWSAQDRSGPGAIGPAFRASSVRRSPGGAPGGGQAGGRPPGGGGSEGRPAGTGKARGGSPGGGQVGGRPPRGGGPQKCPS